MHIRTYGNLNLGCWRVGTCAVFLAFAAHGHAQGIEFIAHNGFEACWSTAKDETAFRALIFDSVEASPGCIPENTGGNPAYCYTTTCAGGVPGCPTVLHGGPSVFAQGTYRFDAQGGLDSVSGKMTASGIECDFSISTSNVTLHYALNYYGPLVADGNNGYYLTAFRLGAVDATGLTAGDVTLSGGLACSFVNVGLGFYAGMLAQVAPSIESALQSTLDYAWCPWPF